MKVTPFFYCLIDIQVLVNGFQNLLFVACWKGLHKLSILVEVEKWHNLNTISQGQHMNLVHSQATELNKLPNPKTKLVHIIAKGTKSNLIPIHLKWHCKYRLLSPSTNPFNVWFKGLVTSKKLWSRFSFWWYRKDDTEKLKAWMQKQNNSIIVTPKW